MTRHPFLDQLRSVDTVARTGRVTRILPTFVQADGPSVQLGTLCEVEAVGARSGNSSILAEVVGVDRESVVLAPLDGATATFPGAKVTATAYGAAGPVGDAFLGRAIDALGRPLDGGPPIHATHYRPIEAPASGPLSRASTHKVLETGVRAIDTLLTLGQGQRVGIFAASGVGKTSLMNQLARQVEADRCVICLVGERGREVEAMWSEGLTREAKARCALVAATSDESAAMRARAAKYALSLAEHWREQGHHVLFLVDSVTRLAMALRELGLAAGEPPTVRAYTPGVFAAIPKLVERCGALKSGGAITAIVTVLAETDDVDDPISELMKSLLDGHIVLSRNLAEQGHFPAIDAPRSISRLADDLMGAHHRVLAQEALSALGAYETSRTLIESGVYMKGADPDIDRAIDLRPAIAAFLRQPKAQRSAFSESLTALGAALERAA